jgi:hypothetical protein
LIALAGFYNYVNNRVPFFNSGEMLEIQVPQGECMQFMFQDGSRVYLEPASQLRYPKNFALGERKVFLDGAGLFHGGKKCKASLYSRCFRRASAGDGYQF